MKIGYVLNSYPMPSHSFIRREIRALEAQGVDVHRFSMRTDRDRLVDPDDMAELERTEIVLESTGAGGLAKAVARHMRHGPGRLFRAGRLALRLGRRSEAGVLRHAIYLAEACHLVDRCAALGIGHVHAHFGTNPATVALLMRTLGGPSYSFTVHGPEEFDHPSALSLDAKIGGAAFTVGISSFGRSQLCRWADPADWDRIEVVHCGVEPAKFSEIPPLPEGPLRLVSIGRFAEQKGQLSLVRALAESAAIRDGAHLTLVGDGPMRAEIEREIARSDLTDRVTLTGWVDEASVREILAGSHLIVMPSFAEGLPMVIMEAMASGRPALATYIAGIPELVTDETGWLVPAGDVAALAGAIDRIAALPAEVLRDRGEAARRRALERHDVHREAARLKDLFALHARDVK